MCKVLDYSYKKFHDLFCMYTINTTKQPNFLFRRVLLYCICFILFSLLLLKVLKQRELRFHTCLTEEELIVDSSGSNLLALPDLAELKWPDRKLSSFPAGDLNVDDKTINFPPPFEPLLSHGQHQIMIELLEIFHKEMINLRLADRFMLHGGSLLGSVRHHDIIPYDDDVDILMDYEVRAKVRLAMMQRYYPHYVLYETSNRMKFYKNVSNNIPNKDWVGSKKTSPFNWKWPYLDISFYTLNKTHMTELARSYNRKYSWPKNVVFPLMHRPFGHKWYPMPNKIHSFIHYMYEETRYCSINSYSHILEGQNKIHGSVPCIKLSYMYPFIEFTTDNGFVREQLYIYLQPKLRTILHEICLPYNDGGILNIT